MGFFNKKQVEALKSGNYICSRCGAEMEFEDEWKDVLVCPKCGESVDIDRYGFESDEEYEALYENDGEDGVNNGNGCKETYDEVYNELDD